ncbi:MAG: hypothetical protein U1E16_14845 [Hyphomicrobiales bacterium]
MKAFIETTILVDGLLKTKRRRAQVRQALSSFDEAFLPQYAIKEMKLGPLHGFVWFHNKLVATPNLPDALNALHGVIRSPKKNLAATAMEALIVAEESIASLRYLPESLGSISPARRERLRRAEMINSLRVHILLAWRKRRKTFTRVVSSLSCFVEDEIVLKNDVIDCGRLKCAHQPCCLRDEFATRPDDLMKLMKVCGAGTRDEDRRRHKALRQLVRTPNRELDSKLCRSLGDAVFALQAPGDAVIVTTNIKDIEPLAAALGKSCTRL